MHKKKHKTAGLVRHKVYWTEPKITGLWPAVQREIRALSSPYSYKGRPSGPFLFCPFGPVCNEQRGLVGWAYLFSLFPGGQLTAC